MQMKTYDELYAEGDAADALFRQGNFEAAEAAYHALLQGAKQAKRVDSFIAAKATLSVLRMYVEMGNHKMALTIWKAPPGSVFGQGNVFLANGQTSLNDMMIYNLIVGYLYSLGLDTAQEIDRTETLNEMNGYLSLVGRYATQEAPNFIPIVIGNWRIHLEEIFKKPFEEVPPSAKVLLNQLEQASGTIEPPTTLSFPELSHWKRDWDKTSQTREPTGASNPSPLKPQSPTASVASRIDEITASMQAHKIQDALQRAQALKNEMLTTASCDPSELGWVLFFEFKCLYTLKRYQAALSQAEEALDMPYSLSANNAAYRASICAELSIRCSRPIDDIVSHAKAAYEERVRANNPRYVAQSLMTAFTLLELRDAEHHAAFFADKLIEFGAKYGSDIAVIRGFIFRMRGALRAGEHHRLTGMVDDLLKTLGPLPKSSDRAEVMGEVALLESTRTPLASNKAKLEQFLAK